MFRDCSLGVIENLIDDHKDLNINTRSRSDNRQGTQLENPKSIQLILGQELSQYFTFGLSTTIVAKHKVNQHIVQCNIKRCGMS
jgi:hypothetical protein